MFSFKLKKERIFFINTNKFTHIDKETFLKSSVYENIRKSKIIV